ncbi:MAG: hypothetical protein RR708_05060 [Bacilli bacterium]
MKSIIADVINSMKDLIECRKLIKEEKIQERVKRLNKEKLILEEQLKIKTKLIKSLEKNIELLEKPFK